MANAELKDVGELITRLLLEIGGGFEHEHIRQRVCQTALCYLQNAIDHVQGACSVQELNKHCDAAAQSLPAESLLIPCGPCRGKGVVEIYPTLADFLRQRPKPRYFTKTRPSQAPDGHHWICTLCSGTFVIRRRASDLQKHLRDAHGFPEIQVRDVFSPRSEEALYEHFGPCTHPDAEGNGWKVSSEPMPRSSRKLKEVDPALPDLNMIDFSVLSKRENIRKITSRNSVAKTQGSLNGQTLVGTTISSSKRKTHRRYKRVKADDQLEPRSYALHPADSETMDTSLAGIVDLSPLPSHFSDAYQDGGYLASGDSSGQSSLVLEHKPPSNGFSRRRAPEDTLQDPYPARLMMLNTM